MKKRMKTGILAILSVLVLVGIILFLRSGQSTYTLDEEAVDGPYEMTRSPELQEQLAKIAEQQKISQNSTVEIQINGEPTVDAGNGKCNMLVGNPSSNEKNLRVTVRLDVDGTILYQSPVLEPGQRIPYVTLEQIPQKGVHAATAEFAVVSPETGEITGAVDAGIQILVE